MKFSVDPWDPSYGVANEAEVLEESTADVDLEIERAQADWAPIAPIVVPAQKVLFVDGVRRIEARVWMDDARGAARPGICASFAAGSVCCDAVARIGPIELGRGLFTGFGAGETVVTWAGEFPLRLCANDTVENLSLALQQRMGEAEIAAAEVGWDQFPADLVVVDGPLRGRQHLSHAVGYIKTHRVSYLPATLHALVGGLAPGERSPLFLFGTHWTRLSWYSRLTHIFDAPWSGIVRCECSADMNVRDAAHLADRVATTLPKFSSEPHKEARAPQNLYPISGLERELRRRMGDPRVVYRALRQSATTSRLVAGV